MGLDAADRADTPSAGGATNRSCRHELVHAYRRHVTAGSHMKHEAPDKATHAAHHLKCGPGTARPVGRASRGARTATVGLADCEYLPGPKEGVAPPLSLDSRVGIARGRSQLSCLASLGGAMASLPAIVAITARSGCATGHA